MNLEVISPTSDRKKSFPGGEKPSVFVICFLSTISRPCPRFSDWAVLWVWPWNVYFRKSIPGDSVIQLFVETTDASPTSSLWRCWIWGLPCPESDEGGEPSCLMPSPFLLLTKQGCWWDPSHPVSVNSERGECEEVPNPPPQVEGRMANTKDC